MKMAIQEDRKEEERVVIFRGWGGLAGIFVVLAMAISLGAASTVVPDEALPFTGSLGLLAAAAATWFTGRLLNVTRPQKTIDEWYVRREAQLKSLVDAGQFVMGAGQPLPSSHEDAVAQSKQLLQHELQQAQQLKDRHTLFFIPMQLFAFLYAAAAVVVAVIGVVGLLGS